MILIQFLHFRSAANSWEMMVDISWLTSFPFSTTGLSRYRCWRWPIGFWINTTSKFLSTFFEVGKTYSKMATLPSTSAGPPPSLTDPGVAVWEWQDEFGRWRPYRSSVCSFIEQSFQVLMVKGRRSLGTWPVNGSIPLGQADSTLAPYIIDLPSLTQFRQDTGKKQLHYLLMDIA